MAFVSSIPQLSSALKRRNSFHSHHKRICMTATDPLSSTKPNVIDPSTWDLTLGSPAKINLFLRIVRKRPDGFHDLASLFQSISLHDKLYFAEKKSTDKDAKEDTLECNIDGIPTDSSNLVLKAISKYRERTNIDKHYYVRLEKTIPHEAGLGGGSSNAATALWAMNELNDKQCTRADLIDYGSEFGSDISFFFSNGTAYCTGRGEIINDTSLPDELLSDMNIFIIKPLNQGLSTGLVFKNLDINQCSTLNPLNMLKSIESSNLLSNKSNLINDLEIPSFHIMPSLLQLKQKLYEYGFPIVLMSGSGTSFYCLSDKSVDLEVFQSTFGFENNVQIFAVNFETRKDPNLWYFQ